MTSILNAIKGCIESNVIDLVQSMLDVKPAAISNVQNLADKVNEAVDILHGPWLYTQGQDLANDQWKVSMSLVIKENDPLPLVKCGAKVIAGEAFFKKYDLTFLRYAFPMQMNFGEQRIIYSIDEKEYAFMVPGILQESRGMYFTCNGTQNKKDFLKNGQVEKMWHTFNDLSAKSKCHYMFCGGDFLYIDGFEEYEEEEKLQVKALGVFELPSIQEWLCMDPKERDIAPFTKEMKKEAYLYYFDEHLKHLKQPELKESMSTNPYMGIWDDHDIFDGYGSYTDSLNNSPVFKGLFRIALEVYLLFQHQTTIDKAHQEGLFGSNSYHFLRYVDNGSLAILGVDNRTERTREKILSQESWIEVLNQLETLHENCRHLVVMLGVPIVYTSVKEIVEVMENPTVEKVFTKFKGLRNQFGMIELEDDGIDHWDCEEHEKERKSVIQMFQTFAERKGVRVTFLSGDVHLGGLGIILPKNVTQINHSDDLEKIASIPTAMVQVISSAIENTSPSKEAAYFLGKKGAAPKDVNENTISKMLQVSQTHRKFKNKILIPYRNYGILKMNGNSLNVKVYRETKQKMNSKFFDWNIPPVQRQRRSGISYVPLSKKLKS